MKTWKRIVRCLICIGLMVGVYNALYAESSLKSTAIIISATPEDNTVGVDITIPISITFSGEIDLSTLNTDTFHLYKIDNLEEVSVPGNIKYDAESKTAYFIPEGELSYATNYRLAIEGGVKDPLGNAVGLGYSWRFTTRNSIGGCGGS